MSSDKGSTIQGTLGVQSKPQDLNKGVIKVKSWTKDADCAYSATMRCPVYASVLKGYKPVSNADVTVVIENDAGFSAKLKLRDNGIGKLNNHKFNKKVLSLAFSCDCDLTIYFF